MAASAVIMICKINYLMHKRCLKRKLFEKVSPACVAFYSKGMTLNTKMAMPDTPYKDGNARHSMQRWLCPTLNAKMAMPDTQCKDAWQYPF